MPRERCATVASHSNQFNFSSRGCCAFSMRLSALASSMDVLISGHRLHRLGHVLALGHGQHGRVDAASSFSPPRIFPVTTCAPPADLGHLRPTSRIEAHSREGVMPRERQAIVASHSI